MFFSATYIVSHGDVWCWYANWLSLILLANVTVNIIYKITKLQNVKITIAWCSKLWNTMYTFAFFWTFKEGTGHVHRSIRDFWFHNVPRTCSEPRPLEKNRVTVTKIDFPEMARLSIPIELWSMAATFIGGWNTSDFYLGIFTEFSLNIRPGRMHVAAGCRITRWHAINLIITGRAAPAKSSSNFRKTRDNFAPDGEENAAGPCRIGFEIFDKTSRLMK